MTTADATIAPTIHWVATAADLTTAIGRWRSFPWLTVDTEFLRVDTYRAQLCLVQIGDGRDAWIIDTIAITDLTLLFARLDDPNTVKVFHAASQDLEIFAQLTGHCPAPVFDTQLAASLLGLGDQLGYAGLAEKQLGVVIDKSLSRTDWSKRPLSAAQIAYAAADVTHLATMYPVLRDELIARSRDVWLAEDGLKAVDPTTYDTRPEDAWKRLRGLVRLDAKSQHAAARLAAWRETEAIARNRPRGWIIDDDAVYRLAERRPGSGAELAALKVLPPKTLDRHGERLLQLLAEPLPDAPPLARDDRLAPEQKKQLERMQETIRNAAATLGVPAGLLAPRAELEAVLIHGSAASVRVLSGWRREQVGNALLAARTG